MQKGTSLLEALLTVSIAVILMLTAAPHCITLIESQRALSIRSQLINSLQYARQDAITHNSITILRAIDGYWANGWQATRELDPATAPETPQTILLERRFSNARILNTETLADRVRFLPNGQSVLVSGGFQAGTFIVCEKGSGRSHRVIINRVGRIRSETKPNDAKCLSRDF